MKRLSLLFVAVACAAILAAPSVRAQGYQFLRANCPSCIVTFGSLSASTVTASTSVQTPDIKGAGGAARITLPAASTDTITSTVVAGGGGGTPAHVLDTANILNSTDALLSIRNHGSQIFVSNANGATTISGATEIGGSLRVDGNALNDSAGVTKVQMVANGATTVKGNATDGAGVYQTHSDTPAAISTGGIHGFYNFGTLKAGVDASGDFRQVPITVSEPTCASTIEGLLVTVAGTGGALTKQCFCTYDGTTAKWVNLMTPSVRSGTSTSCPAS